MNGRDLRFNPLQIAEWLDELLPREEFGTQRALSRELGYDKTRIGQFLNLLRLPSRHLPRLKRTPDLTEYQLRPVVVMMPNRQEWTLQALVKRKPR